MKLPAAAAESCELAAGVVALAPGLAWLPAARALVAADAHFAYEDVIGGALPLWSTAELVATLLQAARRRAVREIVLLGDVVHGARMSEGAMRTVAAALDALRAEAAVTLVAGNHEGRSRAFAVLGATAEAIERDGWLLLHGDRPALRAAGADAPGRALIGHLHPSLRVGGRKSVPAFVAGERLVVLPALTPYSSGLDVLSAEFAAALGGWPAQRGELHVVAAANERLYPFGNLAALSGLLRAAAPRAKPQRFPRSRLRRYD
ncbi:MAG: metallophosphoesterase [Candidatus Baltobacteraceae bacterium]